MTFDWVQQVGVPFAVVVSILAVALSLYLLLRWVLATLNFVKALRTEVGTDSGSTLGARLHALDEAAKQAAEIAQRKAEADKVLTDRIRNAADDLAFVVANLKTMVEQASALAAQNQKYNELAMRLQTERVVNTITNSPTLTHAGGDVNRSDIGANAQVGQLAAGREHQQDAPVKVIVVPGVPVPVTVMPPESDTKT